MRFFCGKCDKFFDKAEDARVDEGSEHSISIEYSTVDEPILIERRRFFNDIRNRAEEEKQLGAVDIFSSRIFEITDILNEIDRNGTAMTFMGKLRY